MYKPARWLKSGRASKARILRFSDFRFQISDFGFRISDFGFRISDFGFRISDFRFQISDFRFRISDFRFRISDFRFQISDFRFQISDFRFQISDLRFWESENFENLKSRHPKRDAHFDDEPRSAARGLARWSAGAGRRKARAAAAPLRGARRLRELARSVRDGAAPPRARPFARQWCARARVLVLGILHTVARLPSPRPARGGAAKTSRRGCERAGAPRDLAPRRRGRARCHAAETRGAAAAPPRARAAPPPQPRAATAVRASAVTWGRASAETLGRALAANSGRVSAASAPRTGEPSRAQ